jgi:hypothetical protein
MGQHGPQFCFLFLARSCCGEKQHSERKERMHKSQEPEHKQLRKRGQRNKMKGVKEGDEDEICQITLDRHPILSCSPALDLVDYQLIVLI